MYSPILTAAGEGFFVVFSWPNILYPLAGTLLAMFFALLPGTRVATLTALAIPLTYGWDIYPVLMLFGALIGGATFMGSVSAIMLNIPGTSANAATLLDGYPMARQGRARTALACSATASALGSCVGILVLVVLLPFMREVVLLLGPPELLMLTILGLTTVTAVSRGSMVKGLALAGVGLLLSFVGQDPRTAELRFTLGSLYLWDGLSVVPLFLGIFSVAEMMDLAVTQRPTISGKRQSRELTGSAREGVLAVFRHPWLFLRSSVLGSVIGIIPGIGASVASFVAYSHAVQSSGEDREKFGRGDIRGVLAPEAANDAKDGGVLVPALAFGIPGNSATALLLAALALHGVAPGRELVSTKATLVFILIWALFLSNWLTSILGLAMTGPLSRVTLLPAGKLVPVMLSVAVISAFAFRGRLADAAAALVFGFLGYGMKRSGWPRVPLVLAIILGPLFEVNYHLTWQMHRMGRLELWSRPAAAMLAVLVVTVMAWGPVTGAAGRFRKERSS